MIFFTATHSIQIPPLISLHFEPNEMYIQLEYANEIERNSKERKNQPRPTNTVPLLFRRKEIAKERERHAMEQPINLLTRMHSRKKRVRSFFFLFPSSFLFLSSLSKRTRVPIGKREKKILAKLQCACRILY